MIQYKLWSFGLLYNVYTLTLLTPGVFSLLVQSYAVFFHVLTYFARTLVEGHMKDKDLPKDLRLCGSWTGTGRYSLVKSPKQKDTHAIKETGQTKMKILSSFNHHHVVPNLNDLLSSVEDKERTFFFTIAISDRSPYDLCTILKIFWRNTFELCLR